MHDVKHLQHRYESMADALSWYNSVSRGTKQTIRTSVLENWILNTFFSKNEKTIVKWFSVHSHLVDSEFLVFWNWKCDRNWNVRLWGILRPVYTRDFCCNLNCNFWLLTWSQCGITCVRYGFSLNRRWFETCSNFEEIWWNFFWKFEQNDKPSNRTHTTCFVYFFFPQTGNNEIYKNWTSTKRYLRQINVNIATTS